MPGDGYQLTRLQVRTREEQVWARGRNRRHQLRGVGQGAASNHLDADI